MYQKGIINCSIQIAGFVHYLQANVVCHFKLKLVGVLLQIDFQVFQEFKTDKIHLKISFNST